MPRQKFSVALLLIAWLSAQMACGGGLLNPPSGGGSISSSARPAPHFSPGFNLFTPEQDIEVGKQSALQVAHQLPLLNDEKTVGYIRQLGEKLANKAPGYHFPFQFNVVATREINAFALPGGYIFVNAGAIMAAQNEGQLAGVIAHEISHVVLRHGTNQMSKAYLAEEGLGILGRLSGARQHPNVGQVINTVGGLGANMLFLRFSRTAERQADLEGAQIMAAAGYDPHDMASFFQILEAQGGQRAPQFLSDHPDPGNRVAAIDQEIPSLRISPKPTHDTGDFEQIKARLGGSASQLSASEKLARAGPRDPNDTHPGARPEPPSASLREFQARDGSFALSYPQNWDGLIADESDMIFAPKGAYGETPQGVVVTHGIFIGTVTAQSSDLETANAAFVQQQMETNRDYRVVRRPERIAFGGRPGFTTTVTGPSTVTGVAEVDTIYTTAAPDGRLFYLVTLAPEDELPKYRPAFEQIISSIRLAK